MANVPNRQNEWHKKGTPNVNLEGAVPWDSGSSNPKTPGLYQLRFDGFQQGEKGRIRLRFEVVAAPEGEEALSYVRTYGFEGDAKNFLYRLLVALGCAFVKKGGKGLYPKFESIADVEFTVDCILKRRRDRPGTNGTRDSSQGPTESLEMVTATIVVVGSNVGDAVEEPADNSFMPEDE